MDDHEPTVQMQLPRMTRAMKTLSAVLAAVWLMEVLLQDTGIGGLRGPLGPFEPLALVPAAVFQRLRVWQLVTYALVHDPANVVGLIFTVLGLWFLGAPLEREVGTRRVFVILGVSTLAGGLAATLAGLVTTALYMSVTLSPAAATTALLSAWCRRHADAPMSFFGLVTLTGRRLLALSVAITALEFVWQRSGTGVAALAGFATGWILGRRPSLPGAPRRRTDSGPRFRVIQGGGGRDLPN